MRVIGLTGGIASGKSTAARVLAELGAVVIDADQLARDVVRPGEPAHREIIATFGNGVLNEDGTINRAALGNIVFADPAARKRLEAITHPAIARQAEKTLAELRRQGTRLVVYMAPLLIEAGVTSRVDEIWVVYVDRETQVRRLMQRDGLSETDALQRIASQMPMEEKRELARVVIDNRGAEAEMARQIREIWERDILGGNRG
ncbi:dephospho-CoA kinase [Geobacter sp. AOG1]|uniref:dephospho-CoA kinase n=1 Tax=Geobacter sp. AOG1 TaxID=1566346 RepID=UPI001CC51460|nr:dephospho-CoA kinase [Geobacter sp. AOG1]GFE56191.1 dephospho-CoA kinase [Geobacter sp. AOG1]